MKTWMKKVCAGLVVALLTATAAQAGDACDIGFCDVGEGTRWDHNNGPHLMSAQPNMEKACDWSFFVQGDLLFWTTYQSQLDYAMQGDFSSNTDDSSATYVSGKVHYIDYDWDFGFRVTGGVLLPWDGWGAWVTWTYFHPDADGSVKDVEGKLLPILWHPAPDSEEVADAADGKLDLKYDTIDFLVGRPFFVSESLALNPFFGVRVLLLDQDYRVHYHGDDFESWDTEDRRGGGYMLFDSEYTGIGLHCGSQFDWNWGCGFSMYGKCAASLIAGRHKTSHKLLMRDDSEGSSSDECLIDIHERNNTWRPGLEMGVGFLWEQSFDCFVRYVMVKVGYELTHWFNTAQPRRWHGQQSMEISGDSSTSVEGLHASSYCPDGNSLGFHGFTLSGRIDF